MKSAISMFIICITCTQTNAQNCKITLRKENVGKTIAELNTPIQFVIRLNDTSLRSDVNGVLEISHNLHQRLKDEHVLDFYFFNALDKEYLRMPMFTRTRRILNDYCGKNLIAEKRL